MLSNKPFFLLLETLKSSIFGSKVMFLITIDKIQVWVLEHLLYFFTCDGIIELRVIFDFYLLEENWLVLFWDVNVVDVVVGF